MYSNIVLLVAYVFCQVTIPIPSNTVVDPPPALPDPSPNPSPNTVSQVPIPAVPSPNPIPDPPSNPVTNPIVPPNPVVVIEPSPRASPLTNRPVTPVEPARSPVITTVVSTSGSRQPNDQVFGTEALPSASATPTTTSNSLESGLPSITIVALVLVGLAILILGIGVFIFKRYGFNSKNENPFMNKHVKAYSSTPLVFEEKENIMGDAFEPNTTQTQGFPQRLNKSNMYQYEQYQAAPMYNLGYTEGYSGQSQGYANNQHYENESYQNAFGGVDTDPFQVECNQQYTHYPNAEYGYEQMPVQTTNDSESFTNSHPSLKFSP